MIPQLLLRAEHLEPGGLGCRELLCWRLAELPRWEPKAVGSGQGRRREGMEAGVGVRWAAWGPGRERVASGQKRGLSQPRGPDISAAELHAARARARRGPETSLAPCLGQRQALAAGGADPGRRGRHSDRRYRAGGYRVGHPERAVVGALGPGFREGEQACKRRHGAPSWLQQNHRSVPAFLHRGAPSILNKGKKRGVCAYRAVERGSEDSCPERKLCV